MPDVSFGGLLVVATVAVAAPLVVGMVPALRVPAVVLEILAGIALGPSGLDWVRIDLPIQIVSLLGLAFVLFLAGMEIDVTRLRGRLLRRSGLGYVVSLALGLGVALILKGTGWVSSPLLVAVALSATSLGLVVPVLKDAGKAEAEIGQVTIAASSVADFSAILLLTLFFSQGDTSPGTKLAFLGGFALLAVAAALALSRLGRSMNLESVLVRLQDTTAQIRVRFAVLLLVAFVAMAERLGLETILGAFLAGAILNLVDRDTMSHPHFRLKLEAIGFGFLVPVFFVTSGLRFDLASLVGSPSALVRVPVFLVALLAVRGLPAILYATTVGRRAAVAAGLLQATSLPFIVTATQIGLLLDKVSPVTAAAMVSAGLLSVVAFPPVALALLRDDGETQPAAAAGRERADRLT
jgi:Kef-type K+ transport system membrane component KefB